MSEHKGSNQKENHIDLAQGDLEISKEINLSAHGKY